MSMIKGSKRLKTAISTQTDCTIDENSEKGVKINVLVPKMKNKGKDVDESSIIELVLQEQNFVGQIDKRQKLLNIPQLCKKQQEMTFLDASNGQSPHQYQRMGINTKEYNKTEDSFACSLDFREMNIGNSCNGRSLQMSANLDHFKNIISHQGKGKQQIQKGNKKKREGDQNEQGGKLMRSQRAIALAEENQEEFKGEKIEVDMKIVEKPIGLGKDSKLSNIVSKMKLSEKYDMKDSVRNQKKIDHCRSNSRIKLKDYLYMVETTSKQLRSNKYENINTPIREGVLNQVKSEQKLKSVPLRPNYKKQGINIVKRDQVSKFQTSTKTMAQILQKDICSEISRGQKMLKQLNKLVSSQNFSKNIEPQSEKLMALYNIRRQLNEKVNTALQEALLKMSTCFREEQHKSSVDSDAQEMTYEDLVKLSRSHK